ncbi:hypothetical protein [Caenimonas koreensis]|uniref:Uncharacterized protein n=1 Tax=Caenimonas koreensis DSM 17982 TaxID=1121255 RepID=A0A844ASI5_9BURK|nr:hypothetical protein [Caenimonas koreensis]MRD47054.1 hypothetical protein [Caenimonas koreensis DSM 17982]
MRDSLLDRARDLASRAFQVILPRNRRVGDDASVMDVGQLVDEASAALREKDWAAAPLVALYNRSTATVNQSVFARMNPDQLVTLRNELEAVVLSDMQVPDSVHAILVIARRCVSDRIALVRESFLSACHKVMLAAGDPQGKPGELADSVIAASRHFENLDRYGGLAGQYQELIEQYRMSLYGLLDHVKPPLLEPRLQRDLEPALRTLRIAPKTDV